ncbi:hyaluronidase A-like [Amphibalanus amphitrite]|uniref:hyaluronidase A-like n=1 Tax=Amphibalanus amphitrite TaxID=1232801 RepID=UPI001C90CB42|nr:hyaluronidase A-like [Amphibalanus amphitrite]
MWFWSGGVEAVRMGAMKMFVVLCLLAWSGSASALNVYWNVPTEECPKSVKFDLSKFGIIQNTGDTFHGDRFNILYQPGQFPHYLQKKVTRRDGRIFKREEPVNGGIPQSGDLNKHLEQLRKDIEDIIPRHYSGPAVIDFEQWQPTLRSTGEIKYRNFSKEYHRSLVAAGVIPDPTDMDAQTAGNYTAEALFERPARQYLEQTLQLARRLRPSALWGYYHYPYCKAYIPHVESCAPAISQDNDKTLWLYENSDALYPSIYYLKYKYTAWEKTMETRSRLEEADRMSRLVGGRPVFPYTWYAYHERHTDFLSPADLLGSLGQAAARRPAGVIIWGGSDGLNSTRLCLRLRDYVEHRLGPFVRWLRSLTDAQLDQLHRHLVESPESFYSQVALLSKQGVFGRWPVNGWDADLEQTEEMKRAVLQEIARELGPDELLIGDPKQVRYEEEEEQQFLM